MTKDIRFVELDVQGQPIAVAVAEPKGQVWTMGTIPDRLPPDSSEETGQTLGSTGRSISESARPSDATVPKRLLMKESQIAEG